MTPADRWCTLCLTRVGEAGRPLAPPSRPPAEPDPAAELTPERLHALLARLEAAESDVEPGVRLGKLALPGGRGQAALLAGAGGLVLLAAGLLALYILGSMV